MANRTAQYDVKIINPMFLIPDGLVGYEYGDEALRLPTKESEIQAAAAASDVYYVLSELADSGSGNAYGLDTPSIIGIISQYVHTASTGQQLVDVLLQIDDIVNAEYDFQVARA